MKVHFCLLFLVLVSVCGATAIIPNKYNQPATPCEIALCCVFQNEAPWLKEWIEYNRQQGVERFYLYNNMSQDDFLFTLAPYVQAGIVELYDFPQVPFRNYDQPTVYNHALERARSLHKWLVIIDTDEFVVPMGCDSLKDYLKAHEHCAGIYPRWLMFGTSHVQNLQDGELLIEKLVFRAPNTDKFNSWGKSIVQVPLTRTVTTAHECAYVENGIVHRPNHDELRLHHYFVRTENFLYQVKIPRLRKWNVNMFSPQSLLRSMPTFNSEYDNTMSRFVEPLKQRMASSPQ